MTGSDTGFKGVTLAAALRTDLGKPEEKWRPGNKAAAMMQVRDTGG